MRILPGYWRVSHCDPKKCRPLGARPGAAFTLLELMVAMALFVMIVAAIYTAWSTVAWGSRAAIRAAAEVQRSRMTMQTFEEALDSTRSFAANLNYYWFAGQNGDNASLSFVSRLPDSFPRSGHFGDLNVRRVTFSLESDSDNFGKQLVLRQNPVLMDMEEDEKNHPVVLAKDVRDFKIGFWDDRKGEWTDEWTEHTNQLPKMVMITLQLGGKNSEATPQEEITRIVALPSLTVQGPWQGGQNLNPGIPQRPPFNP